MEKGKKTVILIAIACVIVHFLCTIFLSHNIDFEYWVEIIQHIESGNGLYELDGYYYTPVWGYLLGFMDMIVNILQCIPVYGAYFTELIPFEPNMLQALVETPEINFLLKAPLAIIDALVGYLIYVEVKDYTGSEKKGIIGMALWCFCPIVIYISAIQGQFDSIVVLLTLLSLVMLRKNNIVLCVIMLSVAVWLKMFPALCSFIILGYIWSQNSDKAVAWKKIGIAAATAIVTTLVLFLPQLIDGTWVYAFSFLTSRTGDSLAGFVVIIGIILSVALMGFLTYTIAKMDPKESDKYLLLFVSFISIVAVFINFGYSYAPPVIAFVIIFAFLLKDMRKYAVPGFVFVTLVTLEALLYMGPMGLYVNGAFLGWFGLDNLAQMASQFVDFVWGLNLHVILITALVICVAVILFIMAKDLYFLKKKSIEDDINLVERESSDKKPSFAAVVSVLFIAVILVGEVYCCSITGDQYGADAQFSGDSIDYSVRCDFGVKEYKAVFMDNDGFASIDEIYIYYDKEYGNTASQNESMPKGAQQLTTEYNIDQLTKLMSIRGFDNVKKVNAAELKERLLDSPTGKGLVMLSGVIPNTVMNSDGSGILSDWIEAGGTLYWAGDAIGKNLSDKGEITVVNAGAEFIGTNNFVKDRKIATFDTESKGVMPYEWNGLRYTFDPDESGTSYKKLGFTDGSNSSITFVSKGLGQVCVFGGDYSMRQTRDMSITICSGICYCTDFVEVQSGNVHSTVTRTFSDVFANQYSVYIYLGGYFCVYGHRFVS